MILLKTHKQPTEWENKFVNNISDMGLLSGIYKEILQVNNKKITQFKNGQRSKKTFLQRYKENQYTNKKMLNIISQWGNKHHNEITLYIN